MAANSQKLTALVRQAAAAGAKIVVLPETAITGYVSQDLRWNWHLAGRPIENVVSRQRPGAVRRNGARARRPSTSARWPRNCRST